MIVLRVDDVGRQPEDTPERGTDGDLKYFARWREAAGLIGLPVSYGIVPTWLTEKGKDWLRNNLTGRERTAVHGWDHARGKQPTLDQMKQGIEMLGTSYIPPFNEYDEEVVLRWGQAGGKVFFGSPPPLQLQGAVSSPTRVNGVIYLPAELTLYSRAAKLLEALPEYPITVPTVLTIHVPWENIREWHYSAALINKLRNKLIDLWYVDQWLSRNIHSGDS